MSDEIKVRDCAKACINAMFPALETVEPELYRSVMVTLASSLIGTALNGMDRSAQDAILALIKDGIDNPHIAKGMIN